jgi:hypothetical protein
MHLGSQHRGSQPFLNRISLLMQFQRNAQLGDALKIQLPSTPFALGWPTSFIQALGPSQVHTLKGAYVVREASIMPG